MKVKQRKDIYRKARRLKLAKGLCIKCGNHYASLFCRKCKDLTCGCDFPCCSKMEGGT
jgi:hypothetical protein